MPKHATVVVEIAFPVHVVIISESGSNSTSDTTDSLLHAPLFL